MPRRPDDPRTPRGTARLSRDAIVEAGIALADRDGLDRLSMRRLAQELGVNPMSIYHHLRDKDALLDAMLDAVVARIEPTRTPEGGAAGNRDGSAEGSADGGGGWAAELRALVLAARRTVLAHPWAAQVLQQRDTPTPAALRHVDRVLGILRGGGCSVALGHHALHLLGSRILGFSQDLFDDSPDIRADPATAAARAAQAAGWAEALPHVAELAGAVSHQGGLGGCDDDAEFDFALDLLLDGLERRRLAEQAG